MAALPKIMMDANGGAFIDFYQRFQQLQLQRDSTDELIRARPPCPPPPPRPSACLRGEKKTTKKNPPLTLNTQTS